MTAPGGAQALPRVAAIDSRAINPGAIDPGAIEHRYDVPFLLAVAAVLALGLVMVASASTSIAARLYGDPLAYFWRQSVYLAIAAGAMAVAARIPVKLWERTGPVLMLAAVALLVLVLIPGIGREVNGSTRWIGFGAFNVQPSELAKLSVVLYLAGYLVRRAEEVRVKRSGFLKPLAVLVVVSLLLLLEPDHGAAVVLCATALGMLFLAGVPVARFALWAGGGGALMAAVALTKPYIVQRLISFLDPWADPYASGYQLTQALIAIGRGGWLGVGLGEGVQKLFYLPEAHTDFLFSVLAEELGLIGMLAIVGLYTFIVLRALSIGRQAGAAAESRFAAYVAYGIGLLIGLHAFVNIGVNIGLLPTKGLTLPLMSYGGSNLVVSGTSIGILLRIDHERRTMRRRAPS